MLIFPLILVTLGCGNVLYVSKLGWHQGYINFHSVSIQEILEDETADGEVKEKVRFIQEVKRFGEERVGLKKTKNFTTFSNTKGPVLHVVTASEKDSLQAYTWTFPITGKVTYKGFFSREDALKEKRELDEKGYDTFIQGAGAYSTLGWLKDPIFSSMLGWSKAVLANLILHEMTHATVYFKGETDFNEQMATFVGNRGVIDFLTERYGPGSKEVTEAIHIQEDDLLFSRWIDQACQRLSTLYGRKISREEKLKERERLFRSFKEEWKGIEARLKTGGYKSFEKIDLNNAVFLAYQRYVHRLETFEVLYERLGQSVKRVVEFFKAIPLSGERPAAFLERWMKEEKFIVPSSLQ